jgi:hypothetical protein
VRRSAWALRLFLFSQMVAPNSWSRSYQKVPETHHTTNVSSWRQASKKSTTTHHCFNLDVTLRTWVRWSGAALGKKFLFLTSQAWTDCLQTEFIIDEWERIALPCIKPTEPTTATITLSGHLHKAFNSLGSQLRERPCVLRFLNNNCLHYHYQQLHK